MFGAPRRRIRLGQPLPVVVSRSYSVRIPPGFPSDPSIKTVADLKAWQPGVNVADVEVHGWVRSVRKSAGVRFVDITDGSSMRPVQAVVGKELSSEMRPGAAVRLKGTWFNARRPPDAQTTVSRGQSSRAPAWTAGTVDQQGRTAAVDGSSAAKAGEATTTTTTTTTTATTAASELQVSEVEILGTSDPQTYPIQNKYQTPESLRWMPHLRPRTPLNSTLLRLRSDATALLTRFFFEEKFQQTHPPLITSSDCEGAGEAFTVKAGGADDFFRDAKYLTVSTQLHLEALAQALGNVWTLSPTFRAERSDTSRHLSEFYMLEAEMSFVRDMDEVMDLVQSMLNFVVRGLKGLRAANELERNRVDSREPSERLAFADLADGKELERRWRGLGTASRWPRISYGEAVERLRRAGHRFDHEPAWGSGLQSEHERFLADEVGYDKERKAYLPVFITQYPRAIKAFYMRQSASSPGEGETVDCFDLIVPSVGELAGGSMREHRLAKLEDNMRLHGLPVGGGGGGGKAAGKDGMRWYLDLRRWGCPPHGGFGLGFDRLLSYLTGVPNVRDVVPFPRHHERCDC
ncbi:hypothetical protein DCS_04189 [Drechmeria coniospora]|uniref:asparagine--tRNA ligase n=1 Tax=Drechmeria coniospora TaxID=98403 RepID=A0A151GJI9_DRECN|nr:hypothetical protein DCS_04189 [Drechmeria coniospora]KYK57182.1 hypothetical protein DCS_04189 [Drechmeria coniospora]ODA79089.1 hypothetical protein RJ55_04680 [Drechmeria coniospora]